MPFVAWAAFCLAPFCVMVFALCPICAQPFLAWRGLPMRRICCVAWFGGVAAAAVLESWLMGRTFARRPQGMTFIDFDAGHA